MPPRSLKPLSTTSPNPRNKSRYTVVAPKIVTTVVKQTGSSKKSKSPPKSPKVVKKTRSPKSNKRPRSRYSDDSPTSKPMDREDDFTKGIDLSQISQWIAITAQVQDIIKGFVKTAPQPQPVVVVQGTTKDTSGQVPQIIQNNQHQPQSQTKQNSSVLNKIKSFIRGNPN